MPEITETFHAPTRADWRGWLESHHAERKEIWLISYRKATGRPSVAYHDAVEEALCFGWIDSVRKSVDSDRWAQRYTPRRAGSPYSQLNLERLTRLIDQNRVISPVRTGIGTLRPESFVIPTDIEAALRADPDAWRHWQRFSAPYRRIRAAYVDLVRDRSPDDFDKRLAHLVRKTAAGKQFGYGMEVFY